MHFGTMADAVSFPSLSFQNTDKIQNTKKVAQGKQIVLAELENWKESLLTATRDVYRCSLSMAFKPVT